MGYSKWIIASEIGEIINKDGFDMKRQWSYPRNLDFLSCNLRYQIYFIKFQQRENVKPFKQTVAGILSVDSFYVRWIID